MRPGVAARVARGDRDPAPSVAARTPTVLKLGSSVLDGTEGYHAAAGEVRRVVQRGSSVLAVVSAELGVTDALLGRARALADDPPAAPLASLLETGETASCALLAVALAGAGVDAHVVGPDELGLFTEGPRLDATPVDLDTAALHGLLERRRVVVAPGFVGRTRAGEPSLLGRGGSDLTALFLAHRLGAACTLLKDVDGLYPLDPARAPRAQSAYRRASWDELLERGRELVQEKAVRYARTHGLSFRVAAIGGRGTLVGAREAVAC